METRQKEMDRRPLSPEPPSPYSHRVVMTALRPHPPQPLGSNPPSANGGSGGGAGSNGHVGGMSFADRKRGATHQRRPSDDRLNGPHSPVIEGDHRLVRTVERGPPGDGARPSRRKSRPDLSKQRSAYFEDVFQIRDANSSRDRVRGESMVTAEVKTNVIIGDEFAFITDLSYLLSNRYQRPITSIAVFVHHGACMLFGGNFEPAYIMTVTALPCQLQTSLNKRNAALIQKHMEEALQVPPSRGTLRFVAVPDENLAVGGRTAAAEIAECAALASAVAASTAANGYQCNNGGAVANGNGVVHGGGGGSGCGGVDERHANHGNNFTSPVVAKESKRGKLSSKASVLSLFRRSAVLPRKRAKSICV